MITIEPRSELENFLRRNYLASQTIFIEPISKGVENRNYRIETGGPVYVLRVYSLEHSTTGVRKRTDIEFELDFMDHARKQGIPTPRAIEDAGGAKVTEIWIEGKSHYAVLFSFLAGQEAPAYHAENARSMAETLLNLHKASLIYRYGTVRRWPGDIVGVGLACYRENREIIGPYRDKLDAIYAQAAEGYRQIQSQPLPFGIVHGDIKLENVLFENNRVKAVLDFDDYRESYLLEDLTRTVMHDLDSVEKNAIRSGQFEQFRKVFSEDKSISDMEMRQLDTFLKARFLYDIAIYVKNGLNGLVEDLFADPHVTEVAFA